MRTDARGDPLGAGREALAAAGRRDSRRYCDAADVRGGRGGRGGCSRGSRRSRSPAAPAISEGRRARRRGPESSPYAARRRSHHPSTCAPSRGEDRRRARVARRARGPGHRRGLRGSEFLRLGRGGERGGEVTAQPEGVLVGDSPAFGCVAHRDLTVNASEGSTTRGRGDAKTTRRRGARVRPARRSREGVVTPTGSGDATGWRDARRPTRRAFRRTQRANFRVRPSARLDARGFFGVDWAPSSHSPPPDAHARAASASRLRSVFASPRRHGDRRPDAQRRGFRALRPRRRRHHRLRLGFRTPSLSAKERAGLAPTLGAGLTRGSGDGDAESFGGDVADPSVAAAPDFGATLCEISCPTSTPRAVRGVQSRRISPRVRVRGRHRPRARRHHRPSLRPLQHRDTRRPGRAPRRRHRRSFPPRRRGRRRQPPNNRANVALVATSAGRVFHWHATSGAVLGDPIVETHNQTFALDVRADGRAFATAGSDATPCARTTRRLRRETSASSGSADGGADRIFAVRYLDDAADVVASAGWDNTLTVWDARAGRDPRESFGDDPWRRRRRREIR